MTLSITTFWSNLCTMHAGLGKLVLLLPDDANEARKCVRFCRDKGAAPLFVGAGTNLVGSDDDFAYCALRLPSKPIVDIDGRLARCNAGALSLRLFRILASRGLGGCAAISGIPGTLGGMLAMNAGANGMEICEVVAEMHGFNRMTDEEWIWRRGDGGWGYRKSPVPPDVCVTDALLELYDRSPQQELDAIDAEMLRRRRVTPSWWSAGSVFRNPSPDMPAGRILDEAGCKGLRHGPFAVSEKHANWIVNAERRNGSAESVKQLIAEMRRRSPAPLTCELRFVLE
ncbi:MAG: FAD-binding protein [Victivallales bacterium]|nr:FAD-binding protein [Victivallales bacterium]